MAITQYRSKRKVSGGRYKSSFKKKLHFIGRLPTLTKLGKTSKKTLRTRGGHTKTFLFVAQTANIYDPVAKKHLQATIETVVESPASRHFARRNIMTKGTIIKTDKGNARITSRPGQEGMINAVLIKK